MLKLVSLFLLMAIYMIVHCQGDTHACDRPCNANEEPKSCVYNFTVESYTTLSGPCPKCLSEAEGCDNEGCVMGDGRIKTVMVVNRALPGPAIRICHRDTVIVNVTNHLTGSETLTIHWHGIIQTDTPFMDGASMVTQCPILRGGSFQYKFTADPPGTHWWHAHTGMQRGEGIAGALIVKQDANEDMSSAEFDEDMENHTIIISDWSQTHGNDRLTNFNFGGAIFFADSLLINGKGYFAGVSDNKEQFRNKFTVQAGKKHRFRVISNVITFCPTDISVDGHKLTIIATDGVAVEPYTVTNLYVRSGERFDFVLHANQAAANYWFRFKTEVECSFTHDAYLKGYLVEKTLGDGHCYMTISTFHSYDGITLTTAPTSTAWETTDSGYKTINRHHTADGFITNLVPLYSEKFPKDTRIEGTPDAVHFLGTGIKGDLPDLNGVSDIAAHSPLLSQPEDTPETCNPEDKSKTMSKFCPAEDYCRCVHVIDINLNDLVDIVLFDKSQVGFPTDHVMHLHGYQFHVLHIEKYDPNDEEVKMEQIKKAYNQKLSTFNTVNPLIKDTVVVPTSGYHVLRFVADRPGVWLFHCHYGMHVNIGMSVSLRVGYPGNFPTPPPNFPKCSSFGGAGKLIYFPRMVLAMSISTAALLMKYFI